MDQKAENQRQMHILAIDDEETTARLYTKLLTQMGHKVTICYTGQETIRAVQEQRFDLVILDLKLPDMHGTDLLNRIQEYLHEAPVIIVTANPSLESSIEAIRTGGVYDYIVKPFSQQDLDLVVSRAVEKTILTAENRRLNKKVDRTNQALEERVGELERMSQIAVDYEKKLAELNKHVQELEKKLKDMGEEQ